MIILGYEKMTISVLTHSLHGFQRVLMWPFIWSRKPIKSQKWRQHLNKTCHKSLNCVSIHSYNCVLCILWGVVNIESGESSWWHDVVGGNEATRCFIIKLVVYACTTSKCITDRSQWVGLNGVWCWDEKGVYVHGEGFIVIDSLFYFFQKKKRQVS